VRFAGLKEFLRNASASTERRWILGGRCRAPLGSASGEGPSIPMARGHGFPRCMRGLPLARIIRDQWIMRAILMTCLDNRSILKSTLLIGFRFSSALSWNISKCIGGLEAQPPKLRTLETNPGQTGLRSRRGWMCGPWKEEVFGHRTNRRTWKENFPFQRMPKRRPEMPQGLSSAIIDHTVGGPREMRRGRANLGGISLDEPGRAGLGVAAVRLNPLGKKRV
jgi:hypothetical protein